MRGVKKSFPVFGNVHYWFALLFFCLGLLSKTMLVTLPFVLLLLDYWPLRRVPSGVPGVASALPAVWRRLCLEKAPFLLLAAAGCVTTLLAQRQAIRSDQGVVFLARIGNALESYVVYLWQTVYPVGLAAFYPHPGNHLSIWRVALSALALLIVSALVIVRRRKYPYLLVGWLWYLGMLVPVIGLVQVGGHAGADRYTYLPQIGLYLMVVWGAVEWCGAWRWRRVVLGPAAVAALAGLMMRAYVQTGYWEDSVSLWTHALACTRDNVVAQNNLGDALAGQGRLAEAVEHYERALQLKPDEAEIHCGLGAALARQGKLAEAIGQYQQALQIRPDDALARYDYGGALASQGKASEAVEQYERALQLKPNYIEAHVNLGGVLTGLGKQAEAIPHFERALLLKPDDAKAHCNLGAALAGQGKLTEAISHYQRALQLKPDDVEAHCNLGAVLASQGKVAQAVQHFEQALNLATRQHKTSMAEVIRARLKYYQSAPVPVQTP